MNRNPSLMSSPAMTWTTNAFERLNNWIKGFGILAGGLSASLADWLTGSIALSVLFSGVELPVPSFVIGTLWSLGAWGVQLLLWEMILSGKAKRLFSKSEVGSTIAVIGAIVLKICDDIVDLLAIFYMMQNSTLKTVVTPEAFTFVAAVVYLLSWILVGFSEIFVSISIYMLRNDKREEKENNTSSGYRVAPFSPNRSNSRPTSTYKALDLDGVMSKLPRAQE